MTPTFSGLSFACKVYQLPNYTEVCLAAYLSALRDSYQPHLPHLSVAPTSALVSVWLSILRLLEGVVESSVLLQVLEDEGFLWVCRLQCVGTLLCAQCVLHSNLDVCEFRMAE